MHTITQSLNQSMPLCIGMDLHSDNVVVCVRQTIQQGTALIGKTIHLKRYKINGLSARQALIEAIAPYCDQNGCVSVVESTYNWYWLADAFERKGWSLFIADPCTVSRANIKHADDYTDSEYLAEQVRIGAIKTAPIMPKNERAVRDLCRFRQSLIQERAKAKITIVNLFTNHLSERIRVNKLVELAYKRLCDDDPLTKIDGSVLGEYFDNALVRVRVASLIRTIMFYDEEIEALDQELLAVMKEHRYASRLRMVKGCGHVLSTAISVEIGDINRFPSHKHFVSYCRLAPTAKLSNGKSKGDGNAKNGNAYLSWAFTELANLVMRFNPEAKAFFDREFNRTKLRVVAIRALAAKLARGIFIALRSGEAFDMKRCFGS